MSNSKIEFAVQMTCENCENAIKKSLNEIKGVHSYEINRHTNTVIVQSTLSTEDLKNRIAVSTGKKVIVKGVGSKAGVAILEFGSENVKGVVRFAQNGANDLCVLDGTIDGLKPNMEHALMVHECGDTSEGCQSVGNVYSPRSRPNKKKYGDLAEVKSQENGRLQFRLEDEILDLNDIIGRSLVVSEVENGKNKKISCGIIARSAGVFQNAKTICACDGVSIWDEGNTPKVK